LVVFFSGVDTRGKVWGMVDVYGNSNIIELVDPRRILSITQQKYHQPVVEKRQYRDYEDNRALKTCSFHPTCKGANVTLNHSGKIATRSEAEFCNGYVFLNSPLYPGESLAVRVLKTESSYIGSLAFGLTSFDLGQKQSLKLPDNSDLLSQRPEYWVHSKDVLPHPHQGDHLVFTLGLDGRVTCSVNGGPACVLFTTNISIPTRPFIDIFGAVQRIELLGVLSNKKDMKTPEIKESMTVSHHCVSCSVNTVDSVLQPCGHVCLCFLCGLDQWGEGWCCPLCGTEIQDVIRTNRV